jgi:membrane protein implicated in regulation of membrane protease activity
MDALFSTLALVEPHHWLALGFVLLIAELVTGTTYILWPAAAAAATALIAWIAPTNFFVELALFGALSILFLIIGRPLLRNLRNDAPTLNERGLQMVGVEGAAAEHFVNGAGVVKINDTVWRAVSDTPIAAGTAIRVLAVDGTTLKVTPA